MVCLDMFPIMRMTMASCLMRMMIPAFSWGHALRRRNPWKRGDDEDADYDDGRYDIDDTDDT